MESIKQKPRSLAAPALPDFRNLGVILRLLLAVNLLALLTVVVRSDSLEAMWAELMLTAARVELPLFVLVLLLYGLQGVLVRLPARSALWAVMALVVVTVAAGFPLLADRSDSLWRWLAWAGGACLATIGYFDYRNRRYSPALTEARLLALTARIRPHFLFNSLNGVLGVIRSDPRRAERALEELADLFRALMQDNRELVPLGDEIALCERYVDLESLRLGDRLSVRWEFAGGDDERAHLLRVRVPPLLLQPLVENAIYHGIEPAPEAGEVVVRVQRRADQLHLEVDNPIIHAERHQAGNRMALANIRERLMLFFDLEAGLDIDSDDVRYRVRIRLPYRSVGA